MKVSGHILEGANVAQQVCKFVNEEQADVVVMSAASHNRLARILLGDLTMQVSGCVNACVLLVRGAEAGKAPADEGKSGITSQPIEASKKVIPDPTSLIKHLLALRDAGILSAEEFKIKKGLEEKRPSVRLD